MKKLSEQEIKDMLRFLENLTFESFQKLDFLYHKAWVEFPLGEIFNPRIAVYVTYWHFSGRLKVSPITGKERFDAQGLEGKAVIQTDLLTAIMVWRELPRFRCNVLVDNSFNFQRLAPARGKEAV
jgi:hypothetical protein